MARRTGFVRHEAYAWFDLGNDAGFLRPDGKSVVDLYLEWHLAQAGHDLLPHRESVVAAAAANTARFLYRI